MRGADVPGRIIVLSALTSRALLEAKRISAVHHVGEEYNGDFYEQARQTKVMDITAQALVFRHDEDDAEVSLSYVGASSRGLGVSAASWWGKVDSTIGSVRENTWEDGGATPALRRMSKLMRRQLEPSEMSFSFSFEDGHSNVLSSEASRAPTLQPTSVAKTMLPTIGSTTQLPTLLPTLLPTPLPLSMPVQITTSGRPTRAPSTANLEPTIGTSTPNAITVSPTFFEVTQAVFLLSSILVEDVFDTFFDDERIGQLVIQHAVSDVSQLVDEPESVLVADVTFGVQRSQRRLLEQNTTTALIGISVVMDTCGLAGFMSNDQCSETFDNELATAAGSGELSERINYWAIYFGIDLGEGLVVAVPQENVTSWGWVPTAAPTGLLGGTSAPSVAPKPPSLQQPIASPRPTGLLNLKPSPQPSMASHFYMSPEPSSIITSKTSPPGLSPSPQPSKSSLTSTSLKPTISFTPVSSSSPKPTTLLVPTMSDESMASTVPVSSPVAQPSTLPVTSTSLGPTTSTSPGTSSSPKPTTMPVPTMSREPISSTPPVSSLMPTTAPQSIIFPTPASSLEPTKLLKPTDSLQPTHSLSPEPTAPPRPTQNTQLPSATEQATPTTPAPTLALTFSGGTSGGKKNNDNNSANIIFIVVGILAALFMCCVLGILYRRKQRYTVAERKNSWDISSIFTDEANLPPADEIISVVEDDEDTEIDDSEAGVVITAFTEAELAFFETPKPQQLQRITKAAEL